jgi:hypothetical protein
MCKALFDAVNECGANAAKLRKRHPKPIRRKEFNIFHKFENDDKPS